MKKIKTVNDFKKTIVLVQLAMSSNWEKFMMKSNLNILLAGGKIRGISNLYALRRCKIQDNLTPEQHQDIIKGECLIGCENMCNLFEEILKKKEWVTESTVINEYDVNGNLIDDVDFGADELIISRREEITTINTYFMDEPIDIEKLKK